MKGKFGKKSKDLMWDLAFELDLERTETAEDVEFREEIAECTSGYRWRCVSMRSEMFCLAVGWDAVSSRWVCEYYSIDGGTRKTLHRVTTPQGRIKDALLDLTKQARALSDARRRKKEYYDDPTFGGCV